MRLVRLIAALLALALIAEAVWSLERDRAALEIHPLEIGETPATVFRLPGAGPAPVVLIAHGFAGSQQLMQPFAMTLARAGYLAVTFDYEGHGRHPRPMTGDVTAEDGVTLKLLEQMDRVQAAAVALPGADGRIAILGHSMASDLVVRYAARHPEVAATIAVSLFSNEVTAAEPGNFLVITGAWEAGLTDEAMRVLWLAHGYAAVEGETYGDLAEGTGRRVVFADGVEHVGVLYSAESMREARGWLDAVFGRETTAGTAIDRRGGTLGRLFLGIVLLAWPLASLLPRLARPERGAGLGWRRFWLPALLPAILTPLIAVWLPRGWLPILVGDYLALHFAVYGLLTLAMLGLARRAAGPAGAAPPAPRLGIVIASAMAVALYATFALGLAFDRYATSFMPSPARLPVMPVMMAAVGVWFLADEWLTRGAGRARGGYWATKLLFIASLAGAIALDLERLFFLIIVTPVILIFFVIYGLMSGWVVRATGEPRVAAIGLALALGWSIAVTFPMLSA